MTAHGETAPDGSLRWSCGHSLDTHTREQANECVARLREGGASAPPDTPEVETPVAPVDTVQLESSAPGQLPAHLTRCIRHHVAYVRDGGSCYICENERPRVAPRVLTHDDNHTIYISTHSVPLTPEYAIRLANDLLSSALRLLDRRDTPLKTDAT